MAFFQLIANDHNKKTKLLTANKILYKRMEIIQNAGRELTHVDINKTHVDFIYSSYKPYIAISSDYSIVKPISDKKLGSSLVFNLGNCGNFINDIIFHCIIKAPDVYVDERKCEDITTYPSVRWADYPGERLMEKTTHTFSQVVTDQYTSDDIVFHRQFHVPDDKLNSWKRAVGQQIEQRGYINDSSQKYAPGHRIYVKTSTGLQTPKNAMEWTATSSRASRPNDLEVFIPLLFWYNLDISQSIQNTGNINITIDLAAQEHLFNYQSRGSSCKVSIGKATISTAELFVNNIYMDQRFYNDMYNKLSYRLIRTHRKYVHKVTEHRSTYTVLGLCNKMTETLYFGLRPCINTQGESNLTNWHQFTNVTPETLSLSKSIEFNVICEKNEPTLDMISIKTGDVILYKSLPLSFYQKYTHSLNARSDYGLATINFCINPGEYQPSGFTSTDVIINYTTNDISYDNPGDLIISTTNINFLIYENGKYILRYN